MGFNSGFKGLIPSDDAMMDNLAVKCLLLSRNSEHNICSETLDDGCSLGIFHIEELRDVCKFSAVVRVGKCWRIPRTANVTFVGKPLEKGHVED